MIAEDTSVFFPLPYNEKINHISADASYNELIQDYFVKSSINKE